MTASLALQTAIRDALLDDALLLTALGGERVYDHVPQGTALPYLTAGDIESRDWSTQASRGHEHTVTIRAWSDGRGRRQAQTLIEAVDRVLDGAALTLEGYRLVNLHVTFWTVVREPDGEAYQGIVRLRAVTEPEG